MANSYVYSYGFAVAFISGYMLWTRSEALRTLDPVPDYLFGVPITIAGVAMLAAGHLGALVSLKQAPLLVTLAGLTLMLLAAARSSRSGYPDSTCSWRCQSGTPC